MMSKIGILLTNTGTPDAPTTGAVRRYLREFLSDKRIVQLPRLLWLPILYGLILPLRPRRSAKLYQHIWLENDSPMRVYMNRLAQLLPSSLGERIAQVEIGMNYGNPSIKEALHRFHENGIEEILVLPLFPQYSNTTTASSIDRLLKAVNALPATPRINGIKSYATHPDYLAALASAINAYWSANGRHAHLLISFHGIPKRYVKAGDPYEIECEATANLLAKALQLGDDQWTLCYQSQFGYDKWLTPSTQRLLLELPQRGIDTLDIVCPGFAVDCLETLEEIAITGEENFKKAGGNSLRYLPALNDSHIHATMLAAIIESHFKAKSHLPIERLYSI